MAKWRCKKARSNFYSPITAYLLFLHAYNFGRIFTTKTCGFVQITVYCQPSSDTLYPPHQQHYNWQDNKKLCLMSAVCNYLHWSEIWPSCPLQFGGKSLISFMRGPSSSVGRKMFGKARISAEAPNPPTNPHGRHEEYLKCFRSPVILMCAICSKEKSSHFPPSRNILSSKSWCFMLISPLSCGQGF